MDDSISNNQSQENPRRHIQYDLPEPLVLNQSVSGSAKVLYAYLRRWSESNEFDFDPNEVAEKFGVSLSVVEQWLEELFKNDILERPKEEKKITEPILNIPGMKPYPFWIYSQMLLMGGFSWPLLPKDIQDESGLKRTKFYKEFKILKELGLVKKIIRPDGTVEYMIVGVKND